MAFHGIDNVSGRLSVSFHYQQISPRLSRRTVLSILHVPTTHHLYVHVNPSSGHDPPLRGRHSSYENYIGALGSSDSELLYKAKVRLTDFARFLSHGSAKTLQ